MYLQYVLCMPDLLCALCFSCRVAVALGWGLRGEEREREPHCQPIPLAAALFCLPESPLQGERFRAHEKQQQIR